MDKTSLVPSFVTLHSLAYHPCLLVCEHASDYIPKKYNSLGLRPQDLKKHIVWDAGTRELTHYLSDALCCTSIVGSYSRLLIDCNRPLFDVSSIAKQSDAIVIPGNQTLTNEEIYHRQKEIFIPFHKEISFHLDRLNSKMPFLINVHSFTKELSCKTTFRPWDISILQGYDETLPQFFYRSLKKEALCIGLNQPYCGKRYGYTGMTHGASRNIPYVILEIRQDHVQTSDQIVFWGDLLKNIISNYITYGDHP